MKEKGNISRKQFLTGSATVVFGALLGKLSDHVYAEDTKPQSVLVPVEMETSDSTNYKKLHIIAGVLRNDGNGWVWIENDRHTQINGSTVSVDNDGYLKVEYGFTAKKVVSLIVTPDETFSSLYTCGASVRLDHCLIAINRLPFSIGGVARYINNAWNVEYSNALSISANSGTIRVNHAALTGYGGNERQAITATSNKGVVHITSGAESSIDMELFDFSGNHITSYENDTRIYFTRTLNAKMRNANTISSSLGNLWLIGLFEVE